MGGRTMRADRGGRKIAAMNRCNPFTRRATLFTRLLVAGALCLTAASPAWADHAPAQDLRSPDARDAARVSASQDLRSPDTRDAARAATVVTQVPVAGWPVNPPVAQTSAPPASDPSPITWSEAGFALALVALVAATMVRRRRPVAR